MSSVQLPAELWAHIFEDNAYGVLDSQDLVAITRCCRRFYNLAITILYQRIVWMDPALFVQSLGMWRACASIASLPRSLVIGLSAPSVNLISIANMIDADGAHVAIADTFLAREHIRYTARTALSLQKGLQTPMLATHSLHSTMINLASSFSNLTTLVFKSCILPKRLRNFVRQFPRLHTLHIEGCAIPENGIEDQDTDDAPLMIEDFRIFDVKTHWTTLDHLDTLTSSPFLISLHVDPTAFRFIQAPWKDRAPPINLRFLTIHAPRHGDLEEGLVRMLLYRLGWMLHSCPKIQVIETVFPFMEDINHGISLNGLSHFENYDLRRYSGPISSLCYIPFVRAAQSLQSLHVWNNTNRDWIEIISRLSRCKNLRVLSLSLSRWDEGIMWAIITHLVTLKGLVRLKISYEVNDPDLVSSAATSSLG